MVLRRTKPVDRQHKVLVVDASSLFRKGRAQNFLDPEHAEPDRYLVPAFEDVPDRAKVVSLDEIKAEGWTLNISRYVLPPLGDEISPLPDAVAAFRESLDDVPSRRGPPSQGAHERRVGRMTAPERRLSQQELESYLWGAATLLRGLVDASDYKQYVFPLLFFKRLSDVWDEEHAQALDDTGDDDYATATRQRPLPDPARCALV